MNFDFRITAIFAYWFDVEITYKNQTKIITSSLYLDNDGPRILLRNLYEMSLEQNKKCWLCWHDEPGAYIWCLEKIDEKLYFFIGEAEKSSDELPFEGDELQKEAIACNKIVGTTLFDNFIKCVVREFSVYSNGEKLDFYEKNGKNFLLKNLIN